MVMHLQSASWPTQLPFVLLVAGAFLVRAQNSGFLYHICGSESSGNYTINSSYKASLDTVLGSITSKDSITTGFYNLFVGQSPNRASVVGLCRGDVSLSNCRTCLNDSSVDIIQRCPSQKEAVIWYDYCMLRYSNRSILGNLETTPAFYMWNVNNLTSSVDLEVFSMAMKKLMDELRSTARAGNSTFKFAVGNKPGPNFYTIYGLAQCSPDLSELDCDRCLGEVQIGGVSECCAGSIGARWFNPSCNIRYEVYRFYNLSEDVQPPSQSPMPAPFLPLPTTNSTPPPEPTRGKENTARIAIIVVASIVSTSILVGALYFWFCRTTKLAEYFKTVEDIRTAESLHYDFALVRAATNNFSEENKLGQGGFGDVYKGKLDGQDLAVKRLSRGHGQGEEEFKTEVLLVAKLQHRNLVRLLGFCLSGEERLLIYEFVPNSSLDRYIFDPVRRRELDWETRLDIIGGIARGLLYLHQDSRLRIIHRDLKASNVLLEADMTPKIADFGTARLSAVDNIDSVTSRIVGTYGYMAPEYALYGQFSIKSDVFSFGVLVLEIVSGQRNVRTQNGELVEDLLTSVWRNWSEGTVLHIIDPLLIEGPRFEILRCVHIGLLCVQENAANRPNMATVILMLNSFTISLPVPTQPALYMQSNIDSSLSFSAASNSSNASFNTSKRKWRQSSEEKTPITGLYPR